MSKSESSILDVLLNTHNSELNYKISNITSLEERVKVATIRNIGIIAHVDAGKTTTTEVLLFACGKINQVGYVHEGATVTDSRPDEKARGITIQSSFLSVGVQYVDSLTSETTKYTFNVIDTPGHVDFSAEVVKALTSIDTSILVVDAKEGAQTQTRPVVEKARAQCVPQICFVNKMDGLGANFERSVESLRQKLPLVPICIQIPMGKESEFHGMICLIFKKVYKYSTKRSKTDKYQPPETSYEIPAEYQQAFNDAREKLLSDLSLYDDTIAEKYLNGEEITPQEIIKVFRTNMCSKQQQIMPVLCGSSYKIMGTEPLIEKIVELGVCPLESAKISTFNYSSEVLTTLYQTPNDSKICTLFVFNRMKDKYLGVLLSFRVFSGSITVGMRIKNTRTGKIVRITKLYEIFVNAVTPVSSISCGNIGAIVIDDCKIGDTLISEDFIGNHDLQLLNLEYSKPVVSQNIEFATKDDFDKAIVHLKDLCERDPSLIYSSDKSSGNSSVIKLQGMGELHLEVVTDELKKVHGIKFCITPTRVEYLETITTPVEHVSYEHKKQNGGNGEFAVIEGSFYPNKRGEGITFTNAVKGGVISLAFLKVIEETFYEFCKHGSTLIPKAQITDLNFTVEDGLMHSVDSNEAAFKAATQDMLRTYLSKGKSIILEPILCNTIHVNAEQYVSAVNSAIGQRSGTITETTLLPTGGVRIIALIPTRTGLNLITHLRSSTSGNVSIETAYHSHEPVEISLINESKSSK